WYVIEAPWAHPAWHSYSLSVIHMRPIGALDGQYPVQRYVEDATHEFLLAALNPEIDRNAMLIGKIAREAVLMPANFGAQFRAEDDASTVARMDATVAEITSGALSPDTDFRNLWVARFGDAMVKR